MSASGSAAILALTNQCLSSLWGRSDATQAAVCGFAKGFALILANHSASLSSLWGAFKRHAGSAPEAVFALAGFLRVC